jgi:hypothetical protein
LLYHLVQIGYRNNRSGPPERAHDPAALTDHLNGRQSDLSGVAKNASKGKGKMNEDNLKIEITPERFEQIEDPSRKLDIIFSAVLVMQKNCGAVCQENDRKFRKLFRRKKIETGAIAASGGIAYFLWGWFKTKIGGGK